MEDTPCLWKALILLFVYGRHSLPMEGITTIRLWKALLLLGYGRLSFSANLCSFLTATVLCCRKETFRILNLILVSSLILDPA